MPGTTSKGCPHCFIFSGIIRIFQISSKLSATDSAGNGLYYSGSLVYSKHGASLTMESCAFTGGRFVATATGVEARYFVTDHLGSVRAVVNGDGEVLERNDYYPFGSRWDDGLLSDNRYRYNGKEAQAFLNNPYLDYGARQYDSDGAVWLGKEQMPAVKNIILIVIHALPNIISQKMGRISKQAQQHPLRQLLSSDYRPRYFVYYIDMPQLPD